MAEWKKNLLLVCLSLLIAFPLLEIAFRILSGIPIFRVENFRQTNVVHVNFGGMADYDPVLGWVLKPTQDGNRAIPVALASESRVGYFK